MKGIFKIEINQNRVFGLDLLRACAITFVLLGHSSTFLNRKIAFWHNKLLYDGVGIFFVLSGFLIGGILIKLLEKNKVSTKLLLSFWFRRWFRTLPNYFLVLTFLYIVSIFFDESFDPISSLRYFFFIQNFSSAPNNFFFDSWSLSIEEWFYLVIPTLLFIIIKISKFSIEKSVIISIIIIIFYTTLYRYCYYIKLNNYSYENFMQIRYSVLGRLDSITYGVLGAYLYHYKYNFWNKNKLLFLFIGLGLIILYYIFPFSSYNFFYFVFSFTLVSISVLLLIPFLNNIKKGTGFFYKIVTYISLTSYSLYLINLRISDLIKYGIDWDAIIAIYHTYISDKYAWTIMLSVSYIFFWVLTISISILIYKYYEVPMTKLRDHKKIKKILNKFS